MTTDEQAPSPVLQPATEFFLGTLDSHDATLEAFHLYFFLHELSHSLYWPLHLLGSAHQQVS